MWCYFKSLGENNVIFLNMFLMCHCKQKGLYKRTRTKQIYIVCPSCKTFFTVCLSLLKRIFIALYTLFTYNVVVNRT